MVDAELDELYQAPLAEFTALRTRLAAAAKKRGDADGAKEISAARKPTTPAWIVNRLVHTDPEARSRLSDLGTSLRAAHIAMNGQRIRELSGEQRRLIDGLSRAAMRAVGLSELSAAVRDDITHTLQAAVADPEVTKRLGRLTKAEHWSGFGQSGDSTTVFADSPAAEEPAPERRSARRSTAKVPPAPDVAAEREQRERREQARAELSAAERAKAGADDALADLRSDLSTARLRLEDARHRLTLAEAAAATAEQNYRDAKQATSDAADAVKAAKAALAGLTATR